MATAITLGEGLAGGVIFWLQKLLFGPKKNSYDNSPAQAVDERVARKIVEVKRSGGASSEVIRSLQSTLLANGVDPFVAEYAADDPSRKQALLAIGVQNLADTVASLPTIQAPQSAISFSQSGMAERLAGWKAIQGTETTTLPQGTNLTS